LTFLICHLNKAGEPTREVVLTSCHRGLGVDESLAMTNEKCQMENGK